MVLFCKERLIVGLPFVSQISLFAGVNVKDGSSSIIDPFDRLMGYFYGGGCEGEIGDEAKNHSLA